MNKRLQKLPEFVRAVLSGLNFSAPNTELLGGLNERDWARVLEFCDASHLTLPLYLRCGERLPKWIRERTARNLQDNGERWEQLKTVYRELASALAGENVPHVVLKGFSQWPLFVADPRHRAQYDIDLLLRPEQICRAADVASRLGYEAIHLSREEPSDHLPPMIRRTGWRWRGDYFDTEIPYSLELHFRCWNSESERFGTPNIEASFRARAIERRCEELSFTGLDTPDSILYASMHAIKHLLHGNLRPSHVYEIAHLLHFQGDNDALWQNWNERHAGASKLQQAICFGLAGLWFGCRIHPIPAELIDSLPVHVADWLALYGYSPLAAKFKPNKDEIWLHWALVENKQERLALLWRKLAPGRLPGAVDAMHIRRGELTWKIRLASQARYLLFVGKRVSHHIRAFLAMAGSAVRWFGKARISRSFT